MENLEMIKVSENGQMYIDFESLESITNAKFVYEIKEDIKIYEGLGRVIDDIEMEIFTNSVSVFIKIENRILVFHYYKNTNRIEKTSITKMDLELFCKMFSKEVDFYG